MKFFNWLDDDYPCDSLESSFNPASGLPMIDDCFDIMGNPFGLDFSSEWDFGSSTGLGFGFDD
jgi:hypothetical protein